ncbi:outer membrane lipoprotein chaperone LolA [Reinekea blandensis]|uniref:Outer-membrane lipoprotein carrier protein n=1 Tax=Reinekea blandensis MED297 TaxID=314283 RepID=A4BDQ5_9GAMM|nr:outer membrane lipoprotein chaperone LolA [Reinekea blandensis]EAR09664.1 outer-membrane lipoprotein carrier protein precursor [Reinekea blandensis MED297]
MIGKKISVFAISFMVMAASYADDQARAALIEQLEALETLSADFEQRTYQETSPRADVSSGTFQLSKPNRFHWHVQEPFEQRVIADGELLWVYDPDLEQATYQSLNQNLSQSPAMILTQPRQTLTDDYGVIKVALEDGVAYRLTPSSDDAIFDELLMRFDPAGHINQLRILDSLGQETQVTFSNVDVNSPLADDLFVFTPPDGTDIFEQM